MITETLRRAAEAIGRAEALFVAAGAGMGVDSGLPDFRGDEGFWRAYPPFAELGYSFVDMANPAWFRRDPALAWGFYGHRLNLYAATRPHHGFELLRLWAGRLPGGALVGTPDGSSGLQRAFVFTSNVDGHFQRAGFAPAAIVECHGSLRHLQCVAPCSDGIWPAGDLALPVDEATMRATPPLPTCPRCGALARPNVLMFGDWHWNGARTGEQERRASEWLQATRDQRLVVVECGAGTAVPTVRLQCERIARATGATLVRINPRESQGPPGTVSVPLGAREALEGIEALLREGGS